MKNHSQFENLSHEFFYIAPDKISNDRVLFGSNESRHIVRVLRHKRGDTICASDGEGSLMYLKIVSDDPRLVEAEIIEREEISPPVKFALSVGLLKGKRMEYVVEKSTELGICGIKPMLTKNTVVKYLSGLRRIRLERIAVAAMKQSRSAWLPKIYDVEPFDKVVDSSHSHDLVLIAHPGGDWQPGDELPASVMIIVGPEGGFTENELEGAITSGAKVLNLGNQRLRSDTAAIVSLIRVKTLFERERKGGELNWQV